MPVSRRRYVVLCLALAALERSARQTTLTILADNIVTACQAEPCFAANGITFDLSNQTSVATLLQSCASFSPAK